jgi:hypothetical protein
MVCSKAINLVSALLGLLGAILAYPVKTDTYYLIHPLIFRRRSFATVGTNFD